MKKLILATLFVSVTGHTAQNHVCGKFATQSQINQCTYQEMKKADARLGKVYNAYMKRLPPAEKAQLKNDELAWIKRKEQACQVEGTDYERGSMQSMVISMCLEEKANQRIVELNRMMKK